MSSAGLKMCILPASRDRKITPAAQMSTAVIKSTMSTKVSLQPKTHHRLSDQQATRAEETHNRDFKPWLFSRAFSTRFGYEIGVNDQQQFIKQKERAAAAEWQVLQVIQWSTCSLGAVTKQHLWSTKTSRPSSWSRKAESGKVIVWSSPPTTRHKAVISAAQSRMSLNVWSTQYREHNLQIIAEENGAHGITVWMSGFPL